VLPGMQKESAEKLEAMLFKAPEAEAEERVCN
jgi:hypothetical protein